MNTLRRLTTGVAAAGLALTGPLAGVAAAEEPADDEAVRSFTAAVDVAGDGSLQVREEIVYDFGSEGHHGLTRAIPVRAPHDSSHDRDYPVGDVRVQSPSGAATQVEQDVDGGVLTLRIGDPDREDVEGEQTYVLTYRIAAVVDDVAGRQEVYYNPVGPDSAVPFDRVDVTLTAPGALSDLRCTSGGRGDTTPCTATPGAAGEATFTATGLQPQEGVTVAAAMPAGTVAAQPPVLDETFSPARAFRADATSLTATGAVLALGGALVAVLRRRRSGGTDTVRGSVRWEPTPPDDAPPGVLGALVHGGATPVDVVATLLDLAQRGQDHSLPQRVRLRATMLRDAIDDFADTTARGFHRGMRESTEEILDFYRRDHMR